VNWNMYRVLRMGFATAVLTGCGGEVDTTYGRLHSRSINGTSIFAGMLRMRGHEVRSAIRLTEELHGWADVIVRFAPGPGPPSQEEAAWYTEWMAEVPGRSMVYIPRDYDALQEYWARVEDELPLDAPPRLRVRVEQARSAAKEVTLRPVQPPLHPASPDEWFAVEGASDAPRVCTSLGGRWASGLDPAEVALTRNQTIKRVTRRLLLSGDGKPLIVEASNRSRARILVIANGGFLLNVPITRSARWPLVQRVVDWIGMDSAENARDVPKRVAFIEGASILTNRDAESSVFALLQLDPFGWVIGQFAILGLAASLAVAPRLGRPRPEPSSGADRPVAHPEALGALLARAGQAREARFILDAYRRWRFGKTNVPAERSSTGDRPRADGS
jgi:hypothetical protein